MQKFELIDNEALINQTCLYNTKPIILNPELALVLGDSDLALVFQQIHYWININKQNAEMELANINTYHNNRFWCFQTYEQWEQQFIWLTKKTIIRKIKKLEDLGIVISGNFNKLNLDKTKWYTIDYKKLLELQNKVFKEKLIERQSKISIRKEQEKKAIQKFKEQKNFKFSEMDKVSISRNGQNVHLQMDKVSIAIQENNYKEINYIQENNIVSQSVVDKQNLKNEMTDGQTDYTQNFKIEIENNDNELNKIVVGIANDLLATQKTITVNNKKICINSLVVELKKLDKNNLLKLIDYVAKKFESNNSDNIKNKNKYIASIFTNAVFEKGYLLNDFKNNNQNISINKQYGKNKFVNYKQEPLDFDLLRQIEIMTLKEGLEDEL